MMSWDSASEGAKVSVLSDDSVSDCGSKGGKSKGISKGEREKICYNLHIILTNIF